MERWFFPAQLIGTKYNAYKKTANRLEEKYSSRFAVFCMSEIFNENDALFFDLAYHFLFPVVQ